MSSERMAMVYEKLYKAVCNQSMNNVVKVAHEIYGKPVLFVDEYFHVVSMHPNKKIGIPVWDAIFENKAMDRDQIFRTLDEFLSGKKAFYKPFYASTGSCEAQPWLLAEVVQDGNVHGHIIVFWDGDPPTEEDFTIIGLVLDAICLRIASRIKSLGSWNLALSTKLGDLLAPTPRPIWSGWPARPFPAPCTRNIPSVSPPSAHWPPSEPLPNTLYGSCSSFTGT